MGKIYMALIKNCKTLSARKEKKKPKLQIFRRLEGYAKTYINNIFIKYINTMQKKLRCRIVLS